MNILVVDDSKFSRKRVISAISGQDHEIHQASDGDEGFETFQQVQPDLVITDLLMPNVDGIGLLKLIRESGSKTPVIVISADIQESSRTLCNEFGIVTFLNKPFKAEELQVAVSNAVAQKSEVENE